MSAAQVCAAPPLGPAAQRPAQPPAGSRASSPPGTATQRPAQPQPARKPKELPKNVYSVDGLQAAAHSAWSPVTIQHSHNDRLEPDWGEGAYGTVSPFVQKSHRGIGVRAAGKQALESNFFSTVTCFAIPPLAFTMLCVPLVFNVHGGHPFSAWLPFLLSFGISANMLKQPAPVNPPHPLSHIHARSRSWRALGGILLLAATVSAGIAGEVIWRLYSQQFYTVLGMMTYEGIDPTLTSGTRAMDGGIVHFTENTRLYPSMGMSFAGWSTYCVAPLAPLSNATSTGSYDFWAVGVDCCARGGTAFRCGEWQNHRAHSGLRVVGEDTATYYRLAVQQAEAAYNIQARNPLFFYWLEDPETEHRRLFSTAFRAWILCNSAHFMLNTFVIITHAIAWSVDKPGM